MISQTSLDAFLQKQAEGILSANERIVLDVFDQYPAGLSNFEVSQLLNWSINRVTGRTNSLVKKGKLFAARKKVNVHSGCLNIVWVSFKHYDLYSSMGFSPVHLEDGRVSKNATSFAGPSSNNPQTWKGLITPTPALPDYDEGENYSPFWDKIIDWMEESKNGLG